MSDDRTNELVRALKEWAVPLAQSNPAIGRLIGALGAVMTEIAQQAGASATHTRSTGASQPGLGATTHVTPSQITRASEGAVSPAIPPILSAPAAASSPRLVSSATAKVTGPRAHVPLKLGDLPPITLAVPGTASAVQSAELAARKPEASTPVARAELPDLDKLARRCELKSQALALVLEDPELMLERSRDERDRLREKAASLGSAGLWPLDVGARLDTATRPLAKDALANLASAARLVHLSRQTIDGSRAVAPQSQTEFDLLMLLAEAQSALRVLCERVNLQEDDDDQYAAFMWLRQVTEQERVFVPRFMRLGDGADPANGADLRERIARAEAHLTAQVSGRKQLKEARSKIAYHAKQMLKDGQPSDAHFERIEASVRTLLANDENDEVIRSLLAQLTSSDIWPHAPESLRDLVSDDDDEDDLDERPARSYGEQVARVRRALAGGRVVITGGEVRPHQRDRLISSLDLGELDWVSLREHASSEPLRASIRRPGTRLVLVLVRLAGHAHVEDAQNECRTLGLPCVLLKAGMNPERVAADIAAQASQVLSLGAQSAA